MKNLENHDLLFQPLDTDEQMDYVQDTAYEPDTIGLEYRYESGTIPIDEELARQAIYAVSGRIDATKAYTQDRIERVNLNCGESGLQEEGDAQTIARFKGDETYEAVEEWVDDIVGAFENIEENIQIKDKYGAIEKMKAVMMEVTAKNDNDPQNFITELGSQAGLPAQRREAPYYIKYGDAIKSFCKVLIEKSGISEAIEAWATHAVTSGLFCHKRMPGTCTDQHIVMHDDSESTGLGKFSKQVTHDQYLKFIPIDSRNLIFRKHHKRGDWVIEKINTRFSALVSKCVDAEGNVLKNPPYDIEMLKSVAKKIKEGKKFTQYTKTVDSVHATYNSDMSDTEIFDIDGDIVVYEAHFVDFRMPEKYAGMPNAKSVKTLISLVQFSDESSSQFVPIGIEPYRFTECQIDIVPFIFRDGDSAGMGLPEVLEDLQKKICDLLALQEDFLKMALYGILFMDESKLVNPDAMNDLRPRDVVRVKSLNGASINSIYSFFMPPMEMVSYVSNAITYLENRFDRLTRKGPSSERMTPKTTATEFSSIAAERKKSVNRVLKRIRPSINSFVSDAYAFALANMEKSSYDLDVKAITTKESPSQATNGFVPVEYQTKTVSFTLEELFAEDLKFEITAFENEDDLALQKQQNLEFVNMIATFGLYDQQTGQPRQFVNDAGSPVELNLWAIITKMATQFGYTAEDIWKEVPAAATPAGQSLTPPTPGMPSPGEASNLQQTTDLSMPTQANMLGAIAGGPFQ